LFSRLLSDEGLVASEYQFQTVEQTSLPCMKFVLFKALGHSLQWALILSTPLVNTWKRKFYWTFCNMIDCFVLIV
jgi:hypothetical protein